MIRKIISCGRTGVELAALDTAIKLGIVHGGWTTRGKRNEDGPLSDAYLLEETLSLGFEKAMEQNSIHSDGTLLITRGQKSRTTQKSVKLALKHQRQFLHTDLSQYGLFEAASLCSSWVSQNHVKTVFVTGPSSVEDDKIYQQTQKILETAFYLGFVKSGLYTKPLEAPLADQSETPQSVAQAVAYLTTSLSLKDRTVLANMHPNELSTLNTGLGEYIKQRFGLYAGNKSLLQSCADIGNLSLPLPDEACTVIVRALWENLSQTHKLRIIR